LKSLRTLAAMTQVAKQFTRFVVVGASNTLLSLAVYLGLLALGVPYPVAAAGGFVVGAANGYLLNRWWTFSAPPASRRQVAAYLAVQVVGLLITVGVVDLLHGRAPVLVGQAVAVPLATVAMFSLNRTWTFRAPARVERTELAIDEEAQAHA
jgi:putative flippase GtrA